METSKKSISPVRSVKRFYRKASRKLTHIYDGMCDRRICGCSLVKYVPSLYRETMGATGSQSTCYWALDKMFKGEHFDENDSFIDVGCGKGRVLAYMVSKKYPCSLTGIELNKEVADSYMIRPGIETIDVHTQSGDYLENRKGWVRKRREMIGKSHGLYMYYNPQGFSLWEYTP